MSQVQYTSIIRTKGHLTIPETIRRIAGWASPLSVVSLSLTHPDEIIITPHQAQKSIDWDALWNDIHLARSFRGKNETKSSLELINQDRAEK